MKFSSFFSHYFQNKNKHQPPSSGSDEGNVEPPGLEKPPSLSDSNEENTEPLGLDKRSSPDDYNEEDWTGTETPEQSDEVGKKLRQRHDDDLNRDKVARHTQGTQQVEQIITRTKTASKNFLKLSVTGAIIIFLVGFFSLPQTREILNLFQWIELDADIANSGHWTIYLLLFLPTTLMAVLGITLWITGLKFSSQIYGGIQGSEEKGTNETVSECFKTVQELLKQNSGSP
ncbi:hypothetical protein [Halomonas sp. GD1P12]|uniref:hypothetical protein n=1 Tax=Halomonas sp. GD1P12 TaxID=2982691 RepID=UPI0021E4B946|nr:hypothetical protein [Halomonas sp. GD1P12]UYF99348.1 hypothetical protein OCT39_14085 [Halomonas sp. GD1P12]